MRNKNYLKRNYSHVNIWINMRENFFESNNIPSSDPLNQEIRSGWVFG
jgi:hypothetical protein